MRRQKTGDRSEETEALAQIINKSVNLVHKILVVKFSSFYGTCNSLSIAKNNEYYSKNKVTEKLIVAMILWRITYSSQHDHVVLGNKIILTINFFFQRHQLHTFEVRSE